VECILQGEPIFAFFKRNKVKMGAKPSKSEEKEKKFGPPAEVI
jgi:hypothetical protein